MLTRLSVQLEEAHLPAGLGVFQTMKQLQLQKIDRSAAGGSERRPAWRLLDSKLTDFLSLPRQLDQLSYRRRQWAAANIGHWMGAMLGFIVGPWALVGIFSVTFVLCRAAICHSIVMPSIRSWPGPSAGSFTH